MMYIGRGAYAAMASEGALKLKEVTYIHAEAYAGGELKHGSIALLDESVPVLALAPRDAVYEKMISNIQEVRARRSPVIAVTTGESKELIDLASDCITIPTVHPLLQPLISVVPLQLFAYYVGVAKGLNVDRPRNLAKSVTVE
jgi:glucosamine--fructose-6-phosphate aminotransferase (isomerizing)